MRDFDDRHRIEVPLQTSMARKCSDVLAPGFCIRVDRYDVLWDGDLIALYEVAYTDVGAIQRWRRAGIVTGGPKPKRVALNPVQRYGDGAQPIL